MGGRSVRVFLPRSQEMLVVVNAELGGRIFELAGLVWVNGNFAGTWVGLVVHRKPHASANNVPTPE